MRLSATLAVSAAALAAVAAAPAGAADYRLPPPPPLYDGPPGAAAEFNWGGLYGGIHGGYATGTIEFSQYGLSTAATRAGNAVGGVALISGLPDATDEAPFFGGYVGMNWLWDDVVLGVEASYTTFNGGFKAYGYADPSATVPQAYQRFSFQDYAVLGVRAGFPIGRFMPYAGLGFAFGRGSDSTYVLAQNGGTLGWGGQYKNGWLWGGAASLGLEYALLDNVILRTEYQWVGFTNFNGTSSQDGATPTLQTIKAGLAIKY
ncbi:outer membrane protein [Alsobacter sp. R-9]